MDAKNVTVGKPKAGGAIFRAPLGTALPADCTSALDAAFKSMGYCSEEGLTDASSISTGGIKAWGGATVHNFQNGKTGAFKFKLIEALNVEVLKAVYGDTNVTGDLEKGVVIRSNSKEQEDCSWVVDMVYNGGYAKRIVVPCAKVTNVGEIKYADNAAVG